MKGQLGLGEVQAKNAALIQANSQNQIENYYRQLDHQLKLGKNQREAEEWAMKQSGINRSAPMNVNGQMVIDWTNAYGRPIKREIVGSAPAPGESYKWFTTPDGRQMAVKPGEEGKIPPGSVVAGNVRPDVLTPSEYAKIAGFKGAVLTGEYAAPNGSGTVKMDETTRDAYKDVINANDPREQIVKIPGQKTGPLSRDIPAQYITIPRTSAEIMALPDDKIIQWDDKQGKAITVGTIKEFARQKGASPEAVLKHLGLIK